MPAQPSGPSAIVITVPAAEPLVGSWRQMMDPAAAQGMPAHITILYPFLAQADLTDPVLADLEEIFSGQEPLDLELTALASFPAGGIYVEPRPAEPIRRLTEQVVARWPQCPPYGGLFDEIIPHMTVAVAPTASQRDDLRSAIVPGLPIQTQIGEAWLFVPDGYRWQAYQRLPFAAR